MAAAKRTGGRAAKVTTNPTPRQVRAATGPGTNDSARDQAYRQGQAAARRALDERRRGRRTRGPAQVHADPELQGYYEQGHGDTVREARRESVRQTVAPAASSAKGLGDNGAGFVLGLVAYALLRNFLTGGWSGVNAWLAAKFVNKTSPAAAPTVNGVPKGAKPAGPQQPLGPLTPSGGGGVFVPTPFGIVNLP